MRKKLLQILILITITNVYGWEDLFRWTTINSLFLYNSKKEIFSQSFNINSSFDIFNAGLSYGNVASSKDELTLYLGLGLGNFIQIQQGFHSDGISIRNQYNIFLITLSFEKFLYSQWANWVFGIGIGFSFPNRLVFDLFKKETN